MHVDLICFGIHTFFDISSLRPALIESCLSALLYTALGCAHTHTGNSARGKHTVVIEERKCRRQCGSMVERHGTVRFEIWLSFGSETSSPLPARFHDLLSKHISLPTGNDFTCWVSESVLSLSLSPFLSLSLFISLSLSLPSKIHPLPTPTVCHWRSQFYS